MRSFASLGVLLALLVATSCGGDEEATGGTVAVTLQEFAVLPAQDSVPAGDVTFNATNNGPADPHELVVIRTDLDPGALPTKDDGSVDENGAGIQIIGEIEEFPVGETKSATHTLSAGSYVLICNIAELEEGQVEAHYALGMRASLTVT